MNDILQAYLRRFVLVFFDDILVYSKTWEEHLDHLKQVLETLQCHPFYANHKKCDFGQREVQYLGHVISGQGVQMDPQKISTILQWPIPKSLKALRGFLGLTGYYRRFVYNYGKMARFHGGLEERPGVTRELYPLKSDPKSHVSLEDARFQSSFLY